MVLAPLMQLLSFHLPGLTASGKLSCRKEVPASVSWGCYQKGYADRRRVVGSSKEGHQVAVGDALAGSADSSIVTTRRGYCARRRKRRVLETPAVNRRW